MDHPRIVFIDVNEPCDDNKVASWIEEAVKAVHQHERIKNKDPAYVILTNQSHYRDLAGILFDTGISAVGYKIPDFGKFKKFCNLVAGAKTKPL